jgi:magnesium chelatase family protein
MVSKTKTFSYIGIEAIAINVEVKITSGNPTFSIVGLPDKAVAESKERVRAAIISTGLNWPFQRITVNLSPADIQKEGSHFDLAIALGIMVEIGVLSQSLIDNFFSIGELSLDGTLNAVSGTLSSAITASQYNCGLICPLANGSEATWAGDHLDIIASPNIISVINHLKGNQLLSRPMPNLELRSAQKYPDLCDVKGQQAAKRCLEIAAAGGHNLMMVGPAGTGKSMLASRLPSIMPDLDLLEILEINMLASVAGKINNGSLITNRPFREVHHSCSMAAMVGGGTKAKPGEVSLAHNGVLFLDELPEFPRQVIDSLRQPLESGKITISRANSKISYPSRFQLIAAMNPCLCGHLGDSSKECKKAPFCGISYQNRISEPIFDRIDLFVGVGRVDFFAESENKEVNNSDIIKQKVIKARLIQKKRYQNEISMNGLSKINSNIQTDLIEKFCKLTDVGKDILQNFAKKNPISMRAINRILRVARTIADLDDSVDINNKHLAEAISYRKK